MRQYRRRASRLRFAADRPTASRGVDLFADNGVQDDGTEEPQDEEMAFGDTITYEDGLCVTIDKPKVFRPFDTAAFDKAPAYRSS